MKKISTMLILVVVLLSLAACATKSQKPSKIKCPACGYEGLDYIYQPEG